MHPHPDPPSVLWSVTPSKAVRTNQSFDARTGLSRDALANQPLLDWIHPEDRPHLEHALNAGTGVVRARHQADGVEWIPMDWTVKTDASGVFALARLASDQQPHVTPVASDSDSAAETGETLNSMAMIVETSNPGLRCSILLVDAETGRIKVGAGPSLPRDYNDAVENLQIGPTLGSCGTAAFWNVPVIVEDIDRDYLWRDLRQAAEAAGVKACWSHPIVATDGVVLGAIALYADQPQSPTASQMDGLEIAARMIGLAIERDRLETQLRQAAQLEAIGRLSGGIAHDFNNILTVILGHIELMRATPAAPEPEILDAISHAVHRASEITSHLLAFGRKQAYNPERVDLGSVVIDVMRVLKPVIGDDVSVSLSLDPSALWVTVDRTQFSQIILNLVINARDAMLPLGGAIEIKTRHTSQEDTSRVKLDGRRESFLVIEVSDSGRGMDSQTMSHVFEPFYSTKEDGNSGLGLSTVYGLTRQNQGFICVESELGKGTTFLLYFPKSDAVTTPPARVTSEACNASVLVVDDNDGIRDVATRILETEAYNVTQARNGAEAISLVEGGLGVDLVLTDVMMPTMGAVEQVHRLRPLLPNVRVLYMSGRPADSLGLPDLESTGDGFLAKPFTPRQLLREVRRTLQVAT